MHIIGCFWFYIVSINKTWVPALDFIWAGQRKINVFWDDSESDLTYKYLVSLYSAVLALGGNEMGPRSELEIVLMIGILLFLAILNADVFGEMTVLVAESSRLKVMF